MDSDPDAARLLLDQAHEEAKRAIAELRDLARGIHPVALTDRGLPGAVPGLAARAPIPVDVRVDVADRPVPAIEGIAYFVVSEALTNVAKHAAATRARSPWSAVDRASSWRSATTGEAVRRHRSAPGCGGWPTGWRRSTARSTWSAPSVAPPW